MLRSRRSWDVGVMLLIFLVDSRFTGRTGMMYDEVGSIGRRNGILLYERLYMLYVIYKFYRLWTIPSPSIPP